jgi:hypothetical protein
VTASTGAAMLTTTVEKFGRVLHVVLVNYHFD